MFVLSPFNLDSPFYRSHTRYQPVSGSAPNCWPVSISSPPSCSCLKAVMVYNGQPKNAEIKRLAMTRKTH